MLLTIPIFVLLLFPLAYAEANLQISSATTPTYIQPGNSGVIELTITNIGTATASSIKASLVNIDSPIQAKTPMYLEDLGSLEAGKSTSLVFRFTVPSGTSSGYYTVQFKIRYCDGSTCKDYIQYALITVQSPTALEISSIQPNELNIGTNNDINYNIA